MQLILLFYILFFNSNSMSSTTSIKILVCFHDGIRYCTISKEDGTVGWQEWKRTFVKCQDMHHENVDLWSYWLSKSEARVGNALNISFSL